MSDSAYGWHKRVRRSFSRIAEVAKTPTLARVQKDSYESFLQQSVHPDRRLNQGLQGAFQFFFPIKDSSGRLELSFVRYVLEPTSCEVDEARLKGSGYAAPLRVTFKLTIFDPENPGTIVREEEQDIYMGEVPLITDAGTFIINGNERVLVSQVHRSPGIFFDHDGGRTHSSGKYLFEARVIPVRGVWLDFEFDGKDLLYVRIDQKRKFLASTLLMALESEEDEARHKANPDKKWTASDVHGLSRSDILKLFYPILTCRLCEDGWNVPASFLNNVPRGTPLEWDLVDSDGTVLAREGERINVRLLRKLQEKPDRCLVFSDAFMDGRFVAEDIADQLTGEIYAEAGSPLTTELMQTIRAQGVSHVALLDGGMNGGESMYMRNTLTADKNMDRQSALFEIYRVLRPGDPPTPEGAHQFFNRLFFTEERYELSVVGRIRLNARVGSKEPESCRILTKSDLLNILRFLIRIREGHEQVDDVDSLANRRVRSVGELVEAQCRLGLLRMQRTIRDRFPLIDFETATPSDIINTKPVSAAIRELFATSQLSQFADQTNPLSEISHKLRISSLGPGGLTRNRASLEVRDVHPTHYGRICPIETPEGQNIGLINSLATYAKINAYGFIEAPYVKVENGKPVGGIVYLSAAQEEAVAIASAGSLPMEDLDTLIECRKGGDHKMVAAREIDYMDISPKQIVSVAASMIPFIENDESGRALMGSNMQRQAVPLYRPQAPLIGTGMERVVAGESCAITHAHRDGIVEQIDAQRIVVRAQDANADTFLVDIYHLTKFRGTNGSTCVHQRPIVNIGDLVKAGDPLTEDFSSDSGEMALGQNILVAFMTWRGYGFEDSIIVSDRLVQNDVFTSIHIEEYEVLARDTKLGSEEITRDIPGVGEENLRHLDPTGTPRIGAMVKAGDILVGKVTPKGESPMTPEERLLRAIFVDKASDVKDSSLRVPSGVEGTVIDVKIFSRKGIDKDERALFIERAEIEAVLEEKKIETRILDTSLTRAIRALCVGQLYARGLRGDASLSEGTELTQVFLEDLSDAKVRDLSVQSEDIMRSLRSLKTKHREALKTMEKRFDVQLEKIQRGADLQPGVIKVAKVFLAVKRKIQPGDKMSGRHGNKGVVSKIVPVEDMPYLEDGTPIDIILNPLGIPSRMNVGQIMETHLGWASYGLGRKIKKQLNTFLSKSPLDPITNMPTDLSPLRTGIQDLFPRAVEKDAFERMDDAQFLEAVARLAERGVPMETPVFDGAKVENIDEVLTQAWGDSSGQVRLRDGRTGEFFDRPVTVGVLYMLKLHHLVDDKIHARSIGPYSLVTQQPVGGRGMLGGQRLGEMEVWTLEAYGAAHTLQEMLTVKSDDISGRSSVYASIVQGEGEFQIGVPASFSVVLKEIRSLGLDIECLEEDFDPEDIWRYCGASLLIKDPSETPLIDHRALSPKAEATRSGMGGEEEGKNFSALRIRVASPEKIRSWSFGEVKRADTINYRTQKPDDAGPFCAIIFGPIKNYECNCGRYKRMKYRGVVCEKCGVEVTLSRVRRERMGHIELAAPVAHVWFTKSLPSRIGTMLDISMKDLDKILSYEHYVVTDPMLTPLKRHQMLSVPEYEESRRQYGLGSFEAHVGAEALKSMLSILNLSSELETMRADLSHDMPELRRKKTIRRFKMFESFLRSGMKPEWMILDVIPVMPPDLRPLVPLDAGRFATSDFNELYRRVINRNNRLKRLIALRAPDIIIRNEKRMLQEIVDALFDNGRRARVLVGANSKRPLKSLSDSLKGKRGRFRQNLLGKRVDYSGRSVIVVGAELKLNQCGLPKKMALELFKPFVYARLERYGLAATVKAAKRMVEQERSEVWDVLEEVIFEHPVLLNRAPTLHRLGIQGFEPILVEGKAIQLHPLVCSAFNADFDGDQMAVHVPLSLEAQLESRILMLSTNNILSPASGRPVIVPSKDMVLGLYYLTLMNEQEKGEGRRFVDSYEAQRALDRGLITLHARITCRVPVWGEREKRLGFETVTTTVGRLILGDALPRHPLVPFEWANALMTSKEIGELVTKVYRTCGSLAVTAFTDKLLTLGFTHATFSGISFGKDDLCVPEEKKTIVAAAQALVLGYHQQYMEGFITDGERKNKVTDAWTRCAEDVSQRMMENIARVEPGKPINAVYMMAHSGARGSASQMRQLAAMRGLIARHDGTIIEHPVISNFKEGLTSREYFNSTHGARKGLSDIALKTANAGHLTRRLVDVAQDCVVSEVDCGTKRGLIMTAVMRGGEEVTPLRERIYGRVTGEDVVDPASGKVVVPRSTLLSEEKLVELQKYTLIEKVHVRSVLTCESQRGICVLCYGQDLAIGLMVQLGTAVGVISAQSIGEPGTQLTMRTFHSGGAAQRSTEDAFVMAAAKGVVSFKNASFIKDTRGNHVVVSRHMEIVLLTEEQREIATYAVPYGAHLKVEEGQTVERGTHLAEWDPYTLPIIAECSGTVLYLDLVQDVSLKETVDEVTGISKRIVADWKQTAKGKDLHPRMLLVDADEKTITLPGGNEARYALPVDAVLAVGQREKVTEGDVLARLPKESFKTSDIIGGLPRVAELFEARYPKIPSIFSDTEGVITLGKDYKIKRKLVVTPEDVTKPPFEYMIPKGRHVLVQEGDRVAKGDLLVDGTPAPHDILRISGLEALAEFLIREMQDVYHLQGVRIHDKHFEIIIRQMLRKIEITDPGDTTLVMGDHVDKSEFDWLNARLTHLGGRLVKGSLVLQGITRASVGTHSYISAASFQETTRVLTEAAVLGKIDFLTGLKENVIAGRLIPAGTGMVRRRLTRIALKGESDDGFMGRPDPINDPIYDHLAS